MADKITITDVVAWIGGITGTVALIWDFYKWWYGERVKLDVQASPNMVTDLDRHTPNVMVRVTNIGKLRTTLKLLTFEVYDTWWQMKKRKPEMQSIVTNPLPGRFPHVLEPGEEWVGLVNQNDKEMQKYRNFRYCFCSIHDAISKKPFRTRVILKNGSEEQNKNQ